MDLVAVGPVLEPNPYVIVTPRRAATLADEVAAALEAFAQDGVLAAIEERWFGPAPALPTPVLHGETP
jgi:polar amino acid transport system substrate-binding protein